MKPKTLYEIYQDGGTFMDKRVAPFQVVDKIGAERALKFAQFKLAEFDISRLSVVKLSKLGGRGGKTALSGYCTYPTKGAGYNIVVRINTHLPLPLRHTHWGRIPDESTQQGWRSGEAEFVFDSVEDAALHALAHELFHFLSHSKQVSDKNTEANANHFADGWLAEFRSEVAA